MAPLIHLTEEAATWLQQEGMVDDRLVTQLTDWDWLTVAVFTCPNSCAAAQEGCAFSEECAIVYNESDAVGGQAGKRMAMQTDR